MAFEAIQSLVRRAIEQFPDRVAIECPQGQLTYAELDAMAADLAGALQAAGAGAGSVVPVLTADRRELVAALLAVLDLGGIVVPLDLTASRIRLEQVLADAGADYAVVGADAGQAAELVDAVLSAAAPAAVRVPAGAGVPAGAEPAPGAAHQPGPDDRCYLFYTSGSTGRPKGIVGRLQGIDHFVRWEAELLGVQPGWRVSQLTSPAFDAVLRDVFVPLTTGGTICVPPADALYNPPALTRWLDEQGINLVHCVPSLFRGIVAEATGENGPALAALRCVAMSGEKLPPREAARWFERFGERIRLLNLYGPTETTMTKLYHFVTPADTQRPAIPIGRPMPGTEVLLLDARGQAVPDGAVGEIHLRTAYRSHGYHRLPDATAQGFVPNPVSGDPDDIVYRTGDFGQLLPDGTLEFLGRKDHQVKIGGVRVELGGVESVLREHPAVDDAAVVVAEEAGGVPYLCAFMELAAEAEPQQLRAFLRDRLPDSAVPAVFVPVDELPRTISGKIDRRALPAPVRTVAEPGADHTPPRTATERAIAAIWASVLPVQEVDVRRSFFDAGGGSLLVLEVLSRLNAEFGVEASVREFLAGPTVESLAVLVESSLLTDDGPLDDLLDSLTGVDSLSDAGALAHRNGG